MTGFVTLVIVCGFLGGLLSKSRFIGFKGADTRVLTGSALIKNPHPTVGEHSPFEPVF